MPIPDQKKFFLDIPIYDSLKIEDSDLDSVFQLTFSEKQIDAYCIHCEKNSVYHSSSNYPEIPGAPGRRNTVIGSTELFTRILGGLSYLESRLITIEFECTRNKKHKMFFIVTVDNSQLIKIGQYPSLADLSNAELGKYRKVLTSEKYKELNRGVGLTTHGVGIGAFVYLRRIFEDLILEAYSNSIAKETLDESSFFKLRMEEKIEFIKASLPEFLVRNKIMYGILSKGIHELSEQECLDIFPVLKLGIELILDEKLEKQMKTEKIMEAEKALKVVQNLLGKDKQ